jgi:hypothetical protein
MTARELPQLGCERPSVVNPRAKVRKKRLAKHPITSPRRGRAPGPHEKYCARPECWEVIPVDGHELCKWHYPKHAPRPRKAKPFRRWSCDGQGSACAAQAWSEARRHGILERDHFDAMLVQTVEENAVAAFGQHLLQPPKERGVS